MRILPVHLGTAQDVVAINKDNMILFNIWWIGALVTAILSAPLFLIGAGFPSYPGEPSLLFGWFNFSLLWPLSLIKSFYNYFRRRGMTDAQLYKDITGNEWDDDDGLEDIDDPDQYH